MSSHRAVAIAALGVGVLVAWTAGCADSDTPPSTGVGPQASSERGGLLLPVEGAQLSQNDPDLGCADNATRGRGLKESFAWSAVSGARSYYLYAIGSGAVYPVIAQTVRDTAFVRIMCNTFVIDRHLTGWEWSVRVVDSNGVIGADVGTGHYSFRPCRLGDGRPCYAPP